MTLWLSVVPAAQASAESAPAVEAHGGSAVIAQTLTEPVAEEASGQTEREGGGASDPDMLSVRGLTARWSLVSARFGLPPARAPPLIGALFSFQARAPPLF